MAGGTRAGEAAQAYPSLPSEAPWLPWGRPSVLLRNLPAGDMALLAETCPPITGVFWPEIRKMSLDICHHLTLPGSLRDACRPRLCFSIVIVSLAEQGDQKTATTRLLCTPERSGSSRDSAPNRLCLIFSFLRFVGVPRRLQLDFECVCPEGRACDWASIKTGSGAGGEGASPADLGRAPGVLLPGLAGGGCPQWDPP